VSCHADECRLGPSLSFDILEVRRLTYYLSGVPKARPLEGWVSWPVNDAPLKGSIERAAERSGARLRFEWQRLTLVFVFQVRLDGKCFDACGQE
jgi:hypothetical protein